MTGELVLYTNPMSRGAIARWMLEEVGEPYRTVILDYGPAMKSPEYLAINPMGKVPALVHGDTVVTEGGAICAYLADAFPSAGLAPPPGDPARGRYYRLMFFAAGPIEAAIIDRALEVQIPADKTMMVGYGSYDLAVEVAAKLLGDGPYLLGERFSAADVYFGSQIVWGTQFGTLPARPEFLAYAERLTARPAAIRAQELDDALRAAEPPTG